MEEKDAILYILCFISFIKTIVIYFVIVSIRSDYYSGFAIFRREGGARQRFADKTLWLACG